MIVNHRSILWECNEKREASEGETEHTHSKSVTLRIDGPIDRLLICMGDPPDPPRPLIVTKIFFC